MGILPTSINAIAAIPATEASTFGIFNIKQSVRIRNNSTNLHEVPVCVSFFMDYSL